MAKRTNKINNYYLFTIEKRYQSIRILQQMQKEVFFHQYRRPRYNNPTFISSNVNQSISFFSGKIDRNQLKPLNHSFNEMTHQGKPYHYQVKTLNNNHLDQIKVQQLSNRQQRSSSLSAYGSNLLSVNQSDIFNKQNSNFNFITMQPKQYDTSIRQHPKLTLQHKDDMYYKRVTEEFKMKGENKQQQQQQMIRSQINNSNTKNDLTPIGKDELLVNHKGLSIAGKYTYGIKGERRRTGSQGHVDGSVQEQQRVGSIINYNSKQFTPKLLNSMDELISLS